jgi:hypothetical protein
LPVLSKVPVSALGRTACKGGIEKSGKHNVPGNSGSSPVDGRRLRFHEVQNSAAPVQWESRDRGARGWALVRGHGSEALALFASSAYYRRARGRFTLPPRKVNPGPRLLCDSERGPETMSMTREIWTR